MSPWQLRPPPLLARGPRASGDEPVYYFFQLLDSAWSPRERG